MSAQYKIHHDADRCVKCGLCVAFCPADCFVMGENGPEVVDLEACMGCDTCSGQCQVRALEVVAEPGVLEFDPYENEPRAEPIGSEEAAMYAEWESIIMDKLDLRWHPVAISLIDADEPLPDVPFPPENLRFCQSLMAARRGQSILMPLHKHACPDGTSIFGLSDVPEKLSTGEIYVLFHKLETAEAAAQMVAERPTLPANSKRATLVTPLSKTPRKPEVVAFTGTPEQMMWLSMSMSYYTGHRFDFHASGYNAECVETTLYPYMTGDPNISFGCYGCRAASDVGEDMMFMGVPIDRMPTVVKGLTELAKKAIPQSRMKIYLPPIM